MPSWSLQVEGVKEWTFAKRTSAEAAVPLGDEFFGAEAYTTALLPGDLLLFFNGWHPHSTEAAESQRFTASVHGVVAFADMSRRLWDPAGVAAKLRPGDATMATPSPRLLHFCPDVRRSGGFDFRRLAEERRPGEACLVEQQLPPTKAARDLAGPFAAVADELGYLSAPAAADMDGDSLVDVVVGQGDGGIRFFRNVGDPGRPAFAPGPSPARALEEAAGGARLLHLAPTAGDVDGDGKADLAVGLYDGRVVFLTLAGEAWTEVAPAIDTDQRRAAPLLLDVDSDHDPDLLVASETGDLDLYLNRGSNFSKGRALRGLGRVPRLAAGTVGAAHILIADGAVPLLRYGTLADDVRGPRLLPADHLAASSPLARLSLDAINDAFPPELADYPAPALADFDADGVDDLLLGGLYGTLLYFNGVAPVDDKFTDDAPLSTDD